MKVEGTKQQWFIALAAVVGVIVAQVWGLPIGASISPPLILALAAIIVVGGLIYVWSQRRNPK